VEGEVGARAGIVVEVPSDEERKGGSSKEGTDLGHQRQVATAPLVGNIKVHGDQGNVTERGDLDNTANRPMRSDARHIVNGYQPKLGLGDDGNAAGGKATKRRRRGGLK
jgi:hypothetical protein